jgi:8-oxo-dGTP diphosphatase
MFTYHYQRPALTVDIIVLVEDEVLLIERGNEPYKGYLALPGGYVDIKDNERPKDAAIRELKEETGLNNLPLEYFGTYDDPHRHPNDRVISMVYVASLKKKVDVAAGDDATNVGWFRLFDIDKMNLAFDHKQIIQDYYTLTLQ